MTKRELVAQYQLFYHITPITNTEAILSVGLKSTKYNGNDSSDAKKARKQIFLTTLNYLVRQIAAMRERYDSEVIVFTVSADILAQKTFGLGYSHSGINSIQKKHTLEALRQMINTY